MKSYKPQNVIMKSAQVGISSLDDIPNYYDKFALWKRAEWWENILGIGDRRIHTYVFYSLQELDNYVKIKYAKELKNPKVVARIIGANEK